MPARAFRFLGLAFLISWSAAGLTYAAGVVYGSGVSKVLTAVTFMLAPALSVLILERKDLKGMVARYGIDLKGFRVKGLLPIALLGAGFVLLCLVWVFILGNVLHLSGFGELIYTPEGIADSLTRILAASGISRPGTAATLPIPPWALLLVSVLTGVILGGIINSFFTFGEELGWRGRLQNDTQGLGLWASTVLIGCIWGFWHTPLILQGHNYPGHPFAGIGMMVLFCIPLSFLMLYARYAVRSVWGAALLHGMVNGTAGIALLFVTEGNPLLSGVAGVAGVLSSLTCLGIVLLADPSFRQNPWRVGRERYGFR